MSKILISTICRNSEQTLKNYISSINELVNHSKHQFYISIYENDSTDKTKNILTNAKFDSALDYKLQHENIYTTFYGSVSNQDRVKNLSKARNKTLVKEFVKNVDYILCYEADVSCNLNTILSLLEHTDYDIISPISMRPNGSLIYDSWATRLTENCVNDALLLKSNVYRSKKIIPVWSTFNTVCLYKAEPFKNNIKFGYYNNRLKTWDCDTVVICENFREMGYTNIAIDTSLIVKELK